MHESGGGYPGVLDGAEGVGLHVVHHGRVGGQTPHLGDDVAGHAPQARGLPVLGPLGRAGLGPAGPLSG